MLLEFVTLSRCDAFLFYALHFVFQICNLLQLLLSAFNKIFHASECSKASTPAFTALGAERSSVLAMGEVS